MTIDPLTLGVAAAFAIGWSVLGSFIFQTLRADATTMAARVWLTAVGGPFVWLCTLYLSVGQLRRSILKRFGVEGYTCCGGHRKDCGHTRHTAGRNTPPAEGQRNDRGGASGGGYHADRITNHPGGHL